MLHRNSPEVGLQWIDPAVLAVEEAWEDERMQRTAWMTEFSGLKETSAAVPAASVGRESCDGQQLFVWIPAIQ